MLKLYYAPRSRAFRALWMLEELGQPYDLVPIDLQAGEQYRPSFRRINPMAKLPAIEHDGVAIAESGAILLYLADRFPAAKLAPPPDDPGRGPFLKWMFFAGSCLEPALMEKVTGQKPEPTRSGWGDYERTEKVLAQGLKKGPWICGESFTAADVIYGSGIQFLMQLKMLPERPDYLTYVTRCVARPAYKRADEIETKAASALDAAKAGQSG